MITTLAGKRRPIVKFFHRQIPKETLRAPVMGISTSPLTMSLHYLVKLKTRCIECFFVRSLRPYASSTQDVVGWVHRGVSADPCGGQLSTMPVPFFLNTGMDPPGSTLSVRGLFPSMHCSCGPTVTRRSGRFNLDTQSHKPASSYRDIYRPYRNGIYSASITTI